MSRRVTLDVVDGWSADKPHYIWRPHHLGMQIFYCTVQVPISKLAADLVYGKADLFRIHGTDWWLRFMDVIVNGSRYKDRPRGVECQLALETDHVEWAKLSEFGRKYEKAKYHEVEREPNVKILENSGS